jgi:SWI/SNF-related matrix-associated actin-dependent regulator of chromatin subfamily A-like protein 1
MFNRMHLYYEQDKLIAKFNYCDKYNAILRRFKGYYDAANNRWVVDRVNTRNVCKVMRKEKHYLLLSNELQREFNVNRHGFSESEIAKRTEWLDNHISNAKNCVDFDEESLEMPYPLLDYQRGGIHYAELKDGRILLADDMGLGKTIQGIGIAKKYKKDWPVVVVAPASLLLNWRSEFLKWLPNDLKDNEVSVMKNSKMNPFGKVVVCSYDYAFKKTVELYQFLGARGILLVDEAQNIKTLAAKRTGGVINLSHFAKRSVLMTGTPILNRIEELYSLVHAIAPQDWGTYYDFVFRYCNAKKTKFGLVVNGISNDEELQRKLRNTIMCRRLKKDVLKQLPEKRRSTFVLEPDKSLKNQASGIIKDHVERIIYYIDDCNEDLQLVKSKILSDQSVNISDTLFEAYKLSGMAKANSLCAWVKEKIESGLKKIIVFGHHADFLDKVQDSIEKMNVDIEKRNNKEKNDELKIDPLGIMRIDGKTSKDKRFKNQNMFQEDPKCNIALLSINAANSGLTLTASNVVIMGELPWTPGVSRQAEDRVHRIGQKENVDIYYTIAEGTFDGALWNMLKNKSIIASKVLDGGKGDEMEEDIKISSGDLLSALILETHDKIKNGDFDTSKIIKKMKKIIDSEAEAK